MITRKEQQTHYANAMDALSGLNRYVISAMCELSLGGVVRVLP